MKTECFRPELRFAVMSDTHVGKAGDERCLRIRKIIPMAYDIAEKNEYHKKLDAVVFVGDMTDEGNEDQFEAFLDSATVHLRGETRLIATVAKGHDCSKMGKAFLDYFHEKTGLPDTFDTVINNFHFIGISTCREEGIYYNEEQRGFLKDSLEKATARDTGKPVFVFHHEHVKHTVYGSSDFDGWGNDYFSDILFEYPQIIDFSGHSHYPLNDPRSIWQGEITAIGTGSVHYAELTADGERRVHPDGFREMAQFLIVEADAANTVRIRGFDALSGKCLCEYYIENPADITARKYTPSMIEAVAKAPYFASENAFEVIKESGRIRIKIPQAVPADDGIIFVYRLTAYDASGAELEKHTVINKYWLGDPDPSIIFEIESGNAAEVTVTAENAFGMKSDDLHIII